jgi:hypothetical protein
LLSLFHSKSKIQNPTFIFSPSPAQQHEHTKATEKGGAGFQDDIHEGVLVDTCAGDRHGERRACSGVVNDSALSLVQLMVLQTPAACAEPASASATQEVMMLYLCFRVLVAELVVVSNAVPQTE